ncbi:Retrovirus-related Pol polyprotein from transposon 17.6, partial [Pseudolycoriella hygida]
MESKILTQVANAVLHPPDQDKYGNLKAKILNNFSDSNHKKMSKLLQDTVLGDKKPSGLLNEMKRLSTPEINEELLKTLWIKRLPTEVRVILSTSTQTLAEMSELADKIVEVANLSNVNAVSKSMPQTSDSQISSLERCIAQLTKAVDKLNQRNSDQRTGPSNRSRSKSRGRSSDNRAATLAKKTARKLLVSLQVCSLAPLNCNLTPITHHRSELERCVKITPNVDSSGKRKNINLNNELFIGDNNTTPNSPKSPIINENPINLNATINRLTVTDHNLNKGFLIDTGADVSVIPATALDLSNSPHPTTLFAANADFIVHYGLLIDLREKRLIDRRTNIGAIGEFQQIDPNMACIKAYDSQNKFRKILAEYTDLTNPNAIHGSTKVNVYHHIETKGAPFFCRPRRLSPEKYKAAQEEFRKLVAQGICKPSKSPWAKQVTFLGHLVSAQGIKPLPQKVSAIRDYSLPTMVKDLKRFLAIINFYRRFIPKAVENQRILQDLSPDIRWIPGESNEVAEFLSRIQGVSSDGKIDFELLAKEQENDSELKSILENEQATSPTSMPALVFLL